MTRGVAGLVGRKLEEQAKEVEARYNALTQRRNQLKAELRARQVTDERIQVALQLREDVILGMENATFDNKQQLLETLNVRVAMKDQKARVECSIPDYVIEYDTTRGCK